jgi:hypothetical protein
MASRALTILASVLSLVAAAPASADEHDAAISIAETAFVTGPAADQNASQFPVADEPVTVAESPAPPARLDLQPLRAQVGGASEWLGDPAGGTANGARMLELFYDVSADAALRPYLGAGVGFANARPNELSCMTLCSALSDADRAIGYQFTAGVTFEVKKDVTLFAEHKLSGLARGSLIDGDGARSDIEGLRDRSFGGGVRIGF